MAYPSSGDVPSSRPAFCLVFLAISGDCNWTRDKQLTGQSLPMGYYKSLHREQAFFMHILHAVQWDGSVCMVK